jgi:polyisoprenoid-binding protein YceI
MRLLTMHALAAALLVIPARTAELLVVQPQSKLWVEGTSTIRSFDCKVPEFTLIVSADGPDAVANVLAGQKAVKALELTVPAARIECGNGTMNIHMRKALKADDNATIRFSLSGYDVAATPKGAEGTVRGTLNLGGVEHPIDVAAVATDAGNGAMRVAGSYEVALSAFDLKRPSLMFGRIKVGDVVTVKFDLTLKK